jgi:hypothetical protein
MESSLNAVVSELRRNLSDILRQLLHRVLAIIFFIRYSCQISNELQIGGPKANIQPRWTAKIGLVLNAAYRS